MVSDKLNKKGAATRDSEGNLLLVNESNQAYRVDESVAAVWSRCDDKTVEQLSDEIAHEIGRDSGEVRGPIENLVSKLKEAQLVE